MKIFGVSSVAGLLTLFISSSVQSSILDVSYTTLDVPGANSTQAYGIDGGNIVGRYDGHGFIYDGTTYTTLDVPGASSSSAYGIDGGNIVGEYHIDSTRHGFIATIPEPIPGPVIGTLTTTVLQTTWISRPF